MYAFLSNRETGRRPRGDVRFFFYLVIHLLMQVASLTDMINFSHFVKRLYAYYHSTTYKISGATFERAYRSKPVHDDVYLLECARYIDRNPLRFFAEKLLHPLYPPVDRDRLAYDPSLANA